jgi:hypothetical protein
MGCHLLKPNKALKQENLQLAVFTAFNILANYKFPLNEALKGSANIAYEINKKRTGTRAL